MPEPAGGDLPDDVGAADAGPRWFRREALSGREAAELAGAVGGLVRAGVALPGALRALADESESAPLRRSLYRVAGRIERGATLGEAIGAEGNRLPAHLPAVIRAAEDSGNFQETVLEAMRFEQMTRGLHRQILSRLAYPTLLIAAFLVVFQLISQHVTLHYAGIFQDFGMSLPLITLGLIQLSSVFASIGLLVPLVGVALVVLVWLASRGVAGGWSRRVAGRVPVLGGIGRDAAMAEFSALLAIVLDARVAMPESLMIAGQGVRDRDLIAACRGAAHMVEQGHSLLDASRAYRLFPQGFDRLLGWAEENRVLPDCLRLASELFAARARARANALGLFLSAMVITLVLLGLILVVLGLYLPLVWLFSGFA